MDDNSDMITRYLLGELNEEEQSRLEERFFRDADFLSELRAVERDLSDSYVRGELPADKRERFEQRFLTSPALRQRVLFADALAKSLARRREASRSAVPKPVVAARFQSYRWLPLAVAASLTCIAIVLFFAWKREVAKPEPPAQIAEEQPRPESPSPAPPQTAQPEEGANRLATEPSGPVSPQQRPEPSPRPRPEGKSTVAMLTLNPGRLRSERGKALTIAPEIQFVQLTLQLQFTDYVNYHAALQTPPGGKTVWQGGPFKPRADGLTFRIPAQRLGPSNLVVVNGEKQNGELEEAGNYYFEVVKEPSKAAR